MSLRRSSRAASLPAALLAASLFLVAPGASADGDKAAAESLFQAGVALMNSGKFAEACPKFVESQRADPSSGTLINLGSCYERTGKLASAWAVYKEAVQLAHKLGQTDREATASGRVAALDPKLSKLRIDAGDVPGMVIKRDGLEMGRGSIGVPIAVDPGAHVITASARGYEDWTTKVTVGDNADAKTVTIPPLKKKPEGAAAPPTGGEGAAAPSSSGLKTAALIAEGVGAAVFVVGGVFFLLATYDKDQADQFCPKKKCNPQGYALIETARDDAFLATIGIGVGLALTSVSTTLLLASGPSAKKNADRGGSVVHARLYPTAGPSGGGLMLVGSF